MSLRDWLAGNQPAEQPPAPVMVYHGTLIRLRDKDGNPQPSWIRATEGQLMSIRRGNLEIDVREDWRPALSEAQPVPQPLAELAERAEHHRGNPEEELRNVYAD